MTIQSNNTHDNLQQQIEDDIQKLRNAKSPQTLEEKVKDWKEHGIDPAKTFDTRGDEDND